MHTFIILNKLKQEMYHIIISLIT